MRIIKNCYFCRLWEFYFYRQGRVDMIGYIQVINFLLDRAKSNKNRYCVLLIVDSNDFSLPLSGFMRLLMIFAHLSFQMFG